MTVHTVQCFDYVNQPYPGVDQLVRAAPDDVFPRCPELAGRVATLRMRLGGLEIGADVAIRVLGVASSTAYDRPATVVSFELEPTSHPRMFPSMTGTLVMFALSPDETQLELSGSYRPPLGPFGELVDAAVAHHVAEASVAGLLRDIAAGMRRRLAPTATATATAAAAAAP
jgi:hypothetical protein